MYRLLPVRSSLDLTSTGPRGHCGRNLRIGYDLEERRRQRGVEYDRCRLGQVVAENLDLGTDLDQNGRVIRKGGRPVDSLNTVPSPNGTFIPPTGVVP